MINAPLLFDWLLTSPTAISCYMVTSLGLEPPEVVILPGTPKD